MKKAWLISMVALVLLITACSQAEPERSVKTEHMDHNLVYVEGGTYVSSHQDGGENTEIASFYIGKYEVTQQEWMEIMDSNPSGFQDSRLPVEMVSWYDAVEYCIKRSLKEGLEPYYNLDKNTKDPDNISEHDQLKWLVTINEGANGYRLPTEAEWEYAATGGKQSKQYKYSGSQEADEVAWYWRNAGDEYLSGDWSWPSIENNKNKTHPVGSKTPNELGLYDMSGNVREWCWDWFEDENFQRGMLRVVKGGGWIGDVSNTEPTFSGKFEANGYGPDQGFRVARNG